MQPLTFLEHIPRHLRLLVVLLVGGLPVEGVILFIAPPGVRLAAWIIYLVLFVAASCIAVRDGWRGESPPDRGPAA